MEASFQLSVTRSVKAAHVRMAAAAAINVPLQELVEAQSILILQTNMAGKALTTDGWTLDDGRKRFNGSVTIGDDRLTGVAPTRAREKRSKKIGRETCILLERRAQVLRNKVKEGGNNRLSLCDVERRSEEEKERKVRSVLSRHLSPVFAQEHRC